MALHSEGSLHPEEGRGQNSEAGHGQSRPSEGHHPAGGGHHGGHEHPGGPKHRIPNAGRTSGGRS